MAQEKRIAKAQQIVKGQRVPEAGIAQSKRSVQHAPTSAVLKTPVRPGTSR